MRLYRSDPAQLDRISALQTAKNSAEEVLHPEDETDRFATPSQLRAAYDDGRIVALPRARLLERGVAIDRGMGELAGRLKRSRTTLPRAAHAGARPARLRRRGRQGDLRRRAARRHEHGARRALPARAAVDATARRRRTTRCTRPAGRSTSCAAYASRAQALAFEFFLERLQSHNLIAWVREPAAIHVTVSADAAAVGRRAQSVGPNSSSSGRAKPGRRGDVGRRRRASWRLTSKAGDCGVERR